MNMHTTGCMRDYVTPQERTASATETMYGKLGEMVRINGPVTLSGCDGGMVVRSARTGREIGRISINYNGTPRVQAVKNGN